MLCNHVALRVRHASVVEPLRVCHTLLDPVNCGTVRLDGYAIEKLARQTGGQAKIARMGHARLGRYAVAPVGLKDLTATASSSIMWKTVYNLVICIKS